MRWKFNSLLLIGLLCASFGSHAESHRESHRESSVVIGGFSHHVNIPDTYEYKGTTRELNETNLALGYSDGDFRYTVYENSYYKTGFAAMIIPHKDINQCLRLGFRLGITTGYEDTPVGLPVTLLAGPEVRVGYNGYYGVIGYDAVSYDKGVLTFHIEVEF